MKKNYYIIGIIIILMSIAGGIYYRLKIGASDDQTKTQNQEPFTQKPNIDFRSLSQKDE